MDGGMGGEPPTPAEGYTAAGTFLPGHAIALEPEIPDEVGHRQHQKDVEDGWKIMHGIKNRDYRKSSSGEAGGASRALEPVGVASPGSADQLNPGPEVGMGHACRNPTPLGWAQLRENGNAIGPDYLIAFQPHLASGHGLARGP